MNTRDILLMSWSEDQKIDGVWYFRFANNNQLFADEYRRQGGKPETVVITSLIRTFTVTASS